MITALAGALADPWAAVPLLSAHPPCLGLFQSMSSATRLKTKMRRRAETPGALERAGGEAASTEIGRLEARDLQMAGHAVGV